MDARGPRAARRRRDRAARSMAEVRRLLLASITMTRLHRLGSCALAVALFSCADLEDDGIAEGAEPEAPDTPSTVEAIAEGRLVLTLHAADGARMPGDVFDTSEAVYLRTQLADATRPVTEGDFAFVVVDARGKRLSSDALDCRRLHLDRVGRVTQLSTGTDIDGSQCRHAATAYDGTLLVQLAPFYEAAASSDGVAEYSVLIARCDEIVDGDFPDTATRSLFVVHAAPACGDGHVDPGEACDDGNRINGDGCSATCAVEQPAGGCVVDCCGNGEIDPGEACDDGNAFSGDGCSETCQIDLAP
jgi:cysteine-rich repeat protein